MRFDITPEAFLGSNGSLSIDPDDEVSLKLAMLIKGECGPDGPKQAAEEFGFSRQRYFQLRTLFHEQGAGGLVSRKRGPKSNYRRTREVVCQTVRYRFLDPEMSSEVIAQKLRQTEFDISARSVDRILQEFGLQKKTLSVSSRSAAPVSGDLSHAAKKSRRACGSSQSRTRSAPTSGG
jgi:hypothetical protein